MQAFREAIETGDHAAIEVLLADDVRFTSPIAFTPYDGKAMCAAILRAVTRVFSDFHYVRQIGDPHGRDHALVFEAMVGDKKLTGCDFLHLDDDGRIDDFMVMVRPLSGANALSDAMGAQFDQIRQEVSRA